MWLLYIIVSTCSISIRPRPQLGRLGVRSTPPSGEKVWKRGIRSDLLKSEFAYLDKDGYLRVLVGNSETKEITYYVAHRLVADWWYKWLFKKPLPAGMIVHHFDEEILNNHIGNLVFPLTTTQHRKIHRKQPVKLSARVVNAALI